MWAQDSGMDPCRTDEIGDYPEKTKEDFGMTGHDQGETTGKARIMQDVWEFSSNTTLHGVRYVTGRNIHRVRRFVWACLLFVIYGFLIYELEGSILKYFGYPVSTVVIINHEEEVIFPAVTMCNHNMVRTDSLQGADPIVLQVIKAKNLPGQVEVDWDIFNNHTKDQPPWNLTEIAFTSGHKIGDMLVDCHWQRHTKCTVADFLPRLTDFGLCYTFNGDGDNPFVVKRPGRYHGLTFSVNIEQEQYTWSEHNGAGLKIYVHPQKELPLMNLHGFSVSPEMETDVTLRYVKRRTLSWPYEPYCDEKVLKYSQMYTVALCRFECEVDALIEACGCKDYRHPGPAPVCSPQQQIECIQKNEEFVADLRHLNCSCPEPCVQDGYQTQISIVQWPSNYYRGTLSEELNVTEEYIKDNFLEVTIFFEEVQYEEISETPTYDGYSLFGDIGGYLGLLCGASLVSFAELADFIFLACTRSRLGKREVSPKKSEVYHVS